MLKHAPLAIPLPVDLLREHRVAVSDIPEGQLLSHYPGDLEVRISDHHPRARTAGLEGFRMAPGAKAANSERSAKQEQPSLVHTPLASTNKGRNPNSRWFIRGVLHDHPKALWIGAFTTFLIFWLVPASVVSSVLLILSSQMPTSFDWVSPQLLWLPTAMLVCGILYLIFGLSSSCRICNQKLFIYRARSKSAQAHHIPGFGYVLPLCVHLMVFRWFRCAHCGTPIRLKK